jgi:UPF0755 protein
LKTFLKLLLVVILLAVVAGAAVAYRAYQRVHEAYQGYTEAEQYVTVPSGTGSREIGRRLVAAGVVRDEIDFRVALWLSGTARRLKAGEYRFDRPMTALEVLDRVAKGDVALVAVTFPEGLMIREMAKIFEANGLGSAESFVAASRNAELVKPLDPAATNLEGYLFPDTYRVPRHTDAARLIRAMTDRFHQVLSPALVSAASARGLSVRQLVTLASIVEKETARPEERATVAAVYANRLKIGMSLQCDPTVIYALQQVGRYDGNLRRDDLMFDSPYNTYRYPGLPPGPIASPGQASLEASASPAAVDYLYFVSRNDGSHEFARTLTEHNRNVQKYQVQYFRDRRTSGRRSQAPTSSARANAPS